MGAPVASPTKGRAGSAKHQRGTSAALARAVRQEPKLHHTTLAAPRHIHSSKNRYSKNKSKSAGSSRRKNNESSSRRSNNNSNGNGNGARWAQQVQQMSDSDDDDERPPNSNNNNNNNSNSNSRNHAPSPVQEDPDSEVDLTSELSGINQGELRNMLSNLREYVSSGLHERVETKVMRELSSHPTVSYIRQLEEEKQHYQGKLRAEAKKNNDLRVTMTSQNRRVENMRKKQNGRPARNVGEAMYANPYSDEED